MVVFDDFLLILIFIRPWSWRITQDYRLLILKNGRTHKLILERRISTRYLLKYGFLVSKLMFLLFHIAVPLGIIIILKMRYYKTEQEDRSILRLLANCQPLTLIISSILPDLIDKPIALIFIESGRTIGHTLLIFFILLGILHVSFKNKQINLAFVVGFLTHLLLDIPWVPWFYPLVLYDFEYELDIVGGWLNSLFHTPLVSITELVGCFILLAIILKYRLFQWNKLQSFLLNRENKSMKIVEKT